MIPDNDYFVVDTVPVNNVLSADNNEPTKRVIPLIDRPLDGFKEQPSGEINQYYVSKGFPNNGSLKKNYYTSYEAANRQPHEDSLLVYLYLSSCG